MLEQPFGTMIFCICTLIPVYGPNGELPSVGGVVARTVMVSMSVESNMYPPMLVIFAWKVKCKIFTHPQNRPLSVVVISLGKELMVIPVQSRKAYLPMLVNPLGKELSVRLEI